MGSRATLPLFAVVVALGCTTDEGVPDGKLARVGDVVFGPDDVAAVGAQLGAYAQLRFAGTEGHVALLGSLVDAEVLAQEAIRQGLGDDPRVRHALAEEIASVYLTTELERRVPYAEIAADVPRLRAWYDANADTLAVAEQRSAQGVVFENWTLAEQAMLAVASGTTTLEELGELLTTPLAVRDDAEFPGFHAVLFDASLAKGELLPRPVPVGERLLVARVHEIVPRGAPPFDDPATRERIVQAVRAPLVAEARAALLRELAERYPEQAPAR
jgi:hypothetical protein